jgi:membrane protein YdbS with pleckstrin-like domain
MSMPNLTGRPATPPTAPAPELLVARVRGHAKRLAWPALLLIAIAGATGYFAGNLPAPFETWMLFAADAVLIVAGVLAPFLLWLSRTYTITTRRVIATQGFLARSRTELSHTRGYTVALRRGVLQRMWGAGTLTLSDGISPPLIMRNVPDATLLHEVLADQVEMSQIQAHRDSQGFSVGHGQQQPHPADTEGWRP